MKGGAGSGRPAVPAAFGRREHEDLRTAFSIFDTEGAGTISVAELRLALRALGSEPQIDEIKSLLQGREGGEQDAQREPAIDFDAFVAIMRQKLAQPETEAEIARGFELLRAPAGDVITVESLGGALRELEGRGGEEEAREMVAAGAEGRVQLTFAEFRAIIAPDAG